MEYVCTKWIVAGMKVERKMMRFNGKKSAGHTQLSASPKL